MFKYIDNRKTINDIFKMFSDSNLIVDDTYQRRSVWNEKDKVRLIETILLNLVIPELFFWKAATDPETGESVTHIVDGQQRIKAISSFINNEFPLDPRYLIDNYIKEKYSNLYFKNLPSDIKEDFWNYDLMIVDIDRKATREDIIKMFYRLNLTDYNLNDQEKRNSLSGEFASVARELSENPIWEKYSLFTLTDVKRMKDVEFCASLILLLRKGIIDQTDQKALNEAYEDFQVGYKDAETDKKFIYKAIDLVSNFFVEKSVKKFLRRKAQLYTLFSVVFSMIRDKKSVDSTIIKSFGKFVTMYSLFSNDLPFEDKLTTSESNIFEQLQKYKLASSEGLNKHTNRMIRFNVLREFLFINSKVVLNSEDTLFEKMKIAKKKLQK